MNELRGKNVEKKTAECKERCIQYEITRSNYNNSGDVRL